MREADEASLDGELKDLLDDVRRRADKGRSIAREVEAEIKNLRAYSSQLRSEGRENDAKKIDQDIKDKESARLLLLQSVEKHESFCTYTLFKLDSINKRLPKPKEKDSDTCCCIQ